MHGNAVDGIRLGQYVTVYRANKYSSNDLLISKLVVIGTRCDEEPLIFVEYFPDSGPVVDSIAEGVTFTYDIPEYDQGCLQATD